MARVERPASTSEAAELIRDTGELAVLIRGAGTKIDWGVPAERTDLVIDTSGLSGVVEHAAGDLITVVRAGTPLSTIDLPGQQLALDPVVPGATVGGTVAANVSGPRRMLYGTARDLLIGITVVRPDGTVAHAGGKVVKNVAGYDLGKLFIGSYGTLGLITECVFRLHPRPAATAVVRAGADTPAEAGRLVAAVLGAQLVPSAIEIDAPPDGPVEVAVLVEGSAPGVRARAAALAGLLGPVTEGEPPWWGRLPWAGDGVGIKLTAPLSGVPSLVAAARSAGVPIRGSAGAGVLYAGLPGGVAQERAEGDAAAGVAQEHAEGDAAAGVAQEHAEGDAAAGVAQERAEGDAAAGVAQGCAGQSVAAADAARVIESLRGAATRAGGHAVVLTAPDEVRRIVDMWGPVGGLALMRRVKDQFDPGRRFAPGRFVGGI